MCRIGASSVQPQGIGNENAVHGKSREANYARRTDLSSDKKPPLPRMTSAERRVALTHAQRRRAENKAVARKRAAEPSK